MESLESKLDRLSPEQRKEALDFVDFLLSREGQESICRAAPCNSPPFLNATPFPPAMIGPGNSGDGRAAGVPDPACPDERSVTVSCNEAASVPFHEISSVQDRITHDYMDYGQFEKQPSPASDAVSKVRRKILVRDDQDKTRHLLDWVD